MTAKSRNFEKMTSQRERLAFGETNERRERNNKRHKPERIAVQWSPDQYDPKLNKRLADRKRNLQRYAVTGE